MELEIGEHEYSFHCFQQSLLHQLHLVLELLQEHDVLLFSREKEQEERKEQNEGRFQNVARIVFNVRKAAFVHITSSLSSLLFDAFDTSSSGGAAVF